MSQVVFKLPKTANPTPAQRRIITEGFRANQHCKGRGVNPYPNMSRKADWWDEGWCEAELCDLPSDRRDEMEIWLAGANE